jgi:hypothetical protein
LSTLDATSKWNGLPGTNAMYTNDLFIANKMYNLSTCCHLSRHTRAIFSWWTGIATYRLGRLRICLTTTQNQLIAAGVCWRRGGPGCNLGCLVVCPESEVERKVCDQPAGHRPVNVQSSAPEAGRGFMSMMRNLANTSRQSGEVTSGTRVFDNATYQGVPTSIF